MRDYFRQRCLPCDINENQGLRSTAAFTLPSIKSPISVADVACADDAGYSSTLVRQYRQIFASAEMALSQYRQILVFATVAFLIEPMNGMCKCRRWLDLNRCRKKACTITPPNAKIIGRNANSFPANPTMRKAKLEKNIKSNASERTRTTDPHNRPRGGTSMIAFASKEQKPLRLLDPEVSALVYVAARAPDAERQLRSLSNL
jgi:hypothetical protein